MAVLGLAVALFAGRQLAAYRRLEADARRLSQALERAALALLRTAYIPTSAAILVTVAGASLQLLHPGNGPLQPPPGAPGTTTPVLPWLVMAAIVGAAAPIAIFYVAVLTSVRGASVLGSRFASGGQAASASPGAAALGQRQASSPTASTLETRASLQVALLVESLSLASPLVVLLAIATTRGGMPGGLADLTSIGPASLAVLLASAMLTTLVLQRLARGYADGALVARELLRRGWAFQAESDPRDPTAVAVLLGTHLTSSASLAIESFCESLFGLALPLLAALRLSAIAPLGVVLATVPLLIRAMAVAAPVFALGAAHRTAEELPERAYHRASLVGLLLVGAAIVGATRWALPNAWGTLAVSSALGLFPLVWDFTTGALPTRWFSRRRPVTPPHAYGRSAEFLGTLGSELLASSLALLVQVVPMTLAWFIGSSSSLPQGGILGVLLCCSVLASTAPWRIAEEVMTGRSAAAMAANAITVTTSAQRAPAETLLEVNVATPRAPRRTQPLLGLALGALFLLPLLRPTPLQSSGMSSSESFPILVGLAAALAVLTSAGGYLRSVASGLSLIGPEAERQLRPFATTSAGVGANPSAQLPPADFTPSYRLCLDQAARASRGTTWIALLPTLAAAALLAGVGRFCGPRLASVSSASLWFIGFATLATVATTVLQNSLARAVKTPGLSIARGSTASPPPISAFPALVGAARTAHLSALACIAFALLVAAVH